MLRRGFKAEAERLADSLRADMGLAAAEPGEPLAIARHLDVRVHAAADLVGARPLKELNRIQTDAFSAITFRLRSGRTSVVYNSEHSLARINSDVAHELAHLILNHDTATIERIGEWNFFTCNSDQEDEANWLAGCLLLPRPLLLKVGRRGWDVERIAREYNVSKAMARFRLNASGVALQLRRESPAARSRSRGG
jgi:Zn-dependent peptidase ImmA (M78 family)